MASKRKKAIGGYRFARFAGQPQPETVDIALPSQVTIDLQPEGASPLRLLVEQGEAVFAGQVIARDDEAVGGPVLASVNGTVEEIRKGADSGAAAVIRSDGTDSWRVVAGYSKEWNNLDTSSLERLVYLSGASAFADGGVPTRFNSAAVEPGEIEHILLQVVPAEVFNPSTDVLLDGAGASQAAEGLGILARIMPGAELHLVGGREQGPLLRQMQEACGRSGLQRVSLHILEPRYPYNREEILVPAVLGQEYPHGYRALNLGVLIVDLQALLAVRDAVVEGKPAIERIVALAGSGFLRRPHLRVRLGADLGQVLQPYLDEWHPYRIVRNSALTGEVIAEGAVDPLMSVVIALSEDGQAPPLSFSRPGFRTDSYSRTFVANFVPLAKELDTSIHGEHRPCIACTYCDSVCPASILPQILHRYVQRGVIDETLVRYRIFDCIDCNLCTYVCPSKIPLSQLMRKGKDRLAAEGLDPRPQAAAQRKLKGIATGGEEQA
jgi:electron transport complex protein RnfC